MFDDNDDLYKYGVDDCGQSSAEDNDEYEDTDYNLDINKQFDKTDIKLLAAQLNDYIAEKLVLESDANNYDAAIEGYNNYLEITLLNKKTNWAAEIQLSYYKLCFYANRLSVAMLSEKITDFIFEADEQGITGDDAQVLFESNI